MEWLVVVAAVVFGVSATAWLAQDRLIFFPQPLASTSHLPARAEPLEVTAGDGTKLRGWILRGTLSPAPTLIYFGGNAEEVSWTLADPRWPREWTIVAVNYRGYGASEGTPGEPALTADALAIHDAVARGDGIDPRRIVVFGRSLGTALAVRVAAARPVAGVVLVSPYDSLAAIGRVHYPWLPVSLLLRHRFDTLADAGRIEAPLLAVVAGDDAIIPTARSRAVYDAWAGPKTWQLVPGADHNTLGADEPFWAGIAAFLARR
jgi:pimeloyl-ACP methyl ester carboxylesterase